jgi:DNA-binding response OmpR family regulator
LEAGDIKVDLLTREVRLAGKPLRLSTTEFELLVYLLRNRGRVVSREEILRAVWGSEHDPGTNIVDVYIGYLRRKLRVHGLPSAPAAGSEVAYGSESPIVTVRSVGYRFDGAC